MRLPKLRQLTEEQKRVYLYAPTDSHVLVHGPPGTGKTLIACLRALELQKRQVPVVLGMFSKVLARYSSNASDKDKLPSQTIYSWFRNWWSSSGVPPHPNCRRIMLQVPFEQKDQAKAAGAWWDAQAWRSWSYGTGAWVVDVDKWLEDPKRFSSWPLWHSPPSVTGKPQSIDWRLVADHILEHEEEISDSELSLGALLIDEGQDFPRDFYITLRNICAAAAARGSRVQHPPRCMVLADENQQLTEENSTLQEIIDSLKIASDHRYVLLDNFRNSKEIALLARSFFADVGVLPNIPERRSELPVFSEVENAEGIVSRVRSWLVNNPGKEVGVFVFDDKKRTAIVDRLRITLGEIRGRTIRLQTYSWNSRKQNPAKELLFDRPDVVTVLNMQSCKGLEFDAVFIVDLHQAQIGLMGLDRFRMQMFVAVSRAREWVQLIDSAAVAEISDYKASLPGNNILLREKLQYVSKSVNARELPATTGPVSKIHVRHESGSASRTLEIIAVKRSDWFTELSSLASQKGLELEDLRHKGGAVWVTGGLELTEDLEPLGFRYAPKRAGWWRKE